MQGCDEEAQSPLGIESGRGYLGQQEKFLQVHQQQKEADGKCGVTVESDRCPGGRRQREGGITGCLLCLTLNCWDQTSGKTLPRPSYPYSCSPCPFALCGAEFSLSHCRSHRLQSVRDSFKVTVPQGRHLRAQVRSLSAITWDNYCTYCLQLPLLPQRSSLLHRMVSIVVYNTWSSVVQGSFKMNWNPRKVT